MKKAFRRIIPILTAVILSLCLALPASAYDVDYGKVSISIANAPEGTAYVELLVPIFDIPEKHFKTHEYKVDLTQTYYSGKDETLGNGYTVSDRRLRDDKKELTIDTDSEIAKYVDEDGYVSLLAHTDLVNDYTVYEKYSNEALVSRNCTMYLSGYDSYRIESSGYCYGVDLNYLEDKFGKIKAAYVDENGHILGVTSAYKADRGNRWGISVSGDALRLTLDDHWDGFFLAILAHLGVNIGLPILCVVILIKVVFWFRKNSK